MTPERATAAAVVALGLAAAALPPIPASACPGLEPCRVDGGEYLALPPPGWDGAARLPATVFFHGYGSSAATVAAEPAITDAFAREGVLLVLPDGLGRTWSHTGSPSQARDEIAFMDAVRRDLLARFPVDPGRILVSGFSQGGSMAWELACKRGAAFAAAYAPISGAFWEPLPAGACPGGPVNLRHVHGTADPTVPMAGRAIRDRFRQGDVLRGMAVLRATNGCAAGEPGRPVAEEQGDGTRCEVWDRCGAQGRELRLCLHGGGHVLPEGWVAAMHAWARGLTGAAEGR